MSYRDMITAVDSRLLSGKEAALYSTCDHGTTLSPAATYVRNPLFWAVGSKRKVLIRL